MVPRGQTRENFVSNSSYVEQKPLKEVFGWGERSPTCVNMMCKKWGLIESKMRPLTPIKKNEKCKI